MLLRRKSPEKPESQYDSNGENGENGEAEEKEDKKPTVWEKVKGAWTKLDLDVGTFMMMMK